MFRRRRGPLPQLKQQWARTVVVASGVCSAAQAQDCAPEIIGSSRVTAADVAVHGSVAYVADGSTSAGLSGLTLLDISDPTNPVILGSVDTPGAARGVAVSGTVAYVADSSDLEGNHAGLLVIEVSNPSCPVILGSVGMPFGWSCEAIAASDGVAYVVFKSRRAGTSGLQVIDVSDPSAPAILSTVYTPGQASDVALSGRIAYVADGYLGLRLVDVSTPSSPVLLGSGLEVPGCLRAIAVSGSVAYGAAWFELVIGRVILSLPILLVIDVSIPFSPTQVGSQTRYGGPGWVSDVAASGGVACMTGGLNSNAILSTFDVSHPSNPLLLDVFNLPDWSPRITVREGVAYVAANVNGVQLIDVSSCLCFGDSTGDDEVDVDDLLAVILNWGSADPLIDITNDGIVDVDDLTAVILAWGSCDDCNDNGVSDYEDLEAGSSLDCNANFVPDECELEGSDCNGNGVLDECDINGGTSPDLNGNGIPDECEDLCPSDTDNDGDVDVDDLVNVITSWGLCDGCSPDVDGDGDVDIDDLLAVLLSWGPCP